MTSTITMQTILPRFWKHWTLRPGKRLYNILSLEMTAEIFTYLDEPAPYLHELGLDRAAAVLAEMDADEAVDILENLDSRKRSPDRAHGSGI